MESHPRRRPESRRAERGFGRRSGLVAIGGVVLSVALLAPAWAQEGEPALPDPLEPVPPEEMTGSIPIDEGNYAGTVGLSGSFWFSEEGVTVIWRGSSSGPIEFAVAGGELTGTWSMAGDADITGYGLPFQMAGVNTWSMTGTVSGSDPYIMEGSGSGSSTVTAAGQTAGSNYGIPTTSAPWEGVMQVCGQVLGNWDQAIEASMDGAPLQHNLRSYFSAFSLDFTTELDQQIESLVERATAFQQNLSGDEILVLGELAVLLAEAEEVMSQIDAQPAGCPADPEFMRIITQIIGDIMNTFLGRWSGQEPDFLQMVALRRLVEVALRAGAIGAGAADAGSASFLEVRAENILQRQFDLAVAQDPMSDQDLTVIAVTATMLGYTFDTGIAGGDICLVLGTC